MAESIFEPIQQAAVIPFYRDRICLILSGSGRRWVVPKGHVEPDETAAEAALREAWEEAGLRGTLCPQPVGSYRYEKKGQVYQVTVFVMEVGSAARDWPEAPKRARRWVACSWAYRCVEEAELRRLLRDVVPNTTLDLLS